MKRLLAILLCATPALASEPPFLPIASCNNGICTMKQADYEKFQRFHVEVGRAFDAMAQHAELLERMNADLAAKLARSPYCQFKRT